MVWVLGLRNKRQDEVGGFRACCHYSGFGADVWF